MSDMPPPLPFRGLPEEDAQVLLDKLGVFAAYKGLDANQKPSTFPLLLRDNAST